MIAFTKLMDVFSVAPHSRSLEGCSPWGRWGSDTTERLHFHFSLSCIGEGKGNPPQCSCLENPRDRGAWWAVVYGVAQSRTRLKRLSSSSSREYGTKWSESTEKNEYYILAVVCGLFKKKWCKWVFLQNRNRLTDTETKLLPKGKSGIWKGEGLGIWD